jgi:S-(hydroxymethyl)glutathione dehydrogenase/alcohol dehydrogenase
VRKYGGRCVFASHPAADERICLDPFDLICGKHIEGSWGGESQPDRDVPIYAENYLAGRLPLNEFLTRRYSLEAINDALDDLANRRVIRALVEIGTPSCPQRSPW